MPEDPLPGVYVEANPADASPIEGVPTSTAGFVGAAHRGPRSRVVGPLASLAELERVFSDGSPLAFESEPATPNFLWHAVRAFFENGGRRCYVSRAFRRGGAADGARPGIIEHERALARLFGVDEIAVVAAPGASFGGGGARRSEALAISQALVAHAERRRTRVAVLDPPDDLGIADVHAWRTGFSSSYGALYYPWLKTTDFSGAGQVLVPPSGFVAGIYARSDAERGVHGAPANEIVRGVAGLELVLRDTDMRRPELEGINALRSFAGRGIVVWGARTLTSDPEWKYVPVRRLCVYLEASICEGLRWVVFEPNDEALWARVRRCVEDFLHRTWRGGALLGAKPEEAYFVRCDRTTMTQSDVASGRLIVRIGVAALRPAEFSVFQVCVRTRRDPP